MLTEEDKKDLDELDRALTRVRNRAYGIAGTAHEMQTFVARLREVM